MINAVSVVWLKLLQVGDCPARGSNMINATFKDLGDPGHFPPMVSRAEFLARSES
jgi:hypothetical protein